jgi:hypothetical protein
MDVLFTNVVEIDKQIVITIRADLLMMKGQRMKELMLNGSIVQTIEWVKIDLLLSSSVDLSQVGVASPLLFDFIQMIGVHSDTIVR